MNEPTQLQARSARTRPHTATSKTKSKAKPKAKSAHAKTAHSKTAHSKTDHGKNPRLRKEPQGAFAELIPELQRAVAAEGYDTPTPIQEQDGRFFPAAPPGPFRPSPPAPERHPAGAHPRPDP